MSWALDPDSGDVTWVNDGQGDPSTNGRNSARAQLVPGAASSTPTIYGQTQHSGPGSGVPKAPSSDADDFARSVVDPGSPNYRGPGWELVTQNGKLVAVLSKDPLKQIQQSRYEIDKNGGMTIPTSSNILDSSRFGGVDVSSLIKPPTTTNRDLNPYPDKGSERFGAGIDFGKYKSPALDSMTIPVGYKQPGQYVVGGSNIQNQLRDRFDNLMGGGKGPTEPPPPGAQAPNVDRSNIDPLFDNINKFQGRFDTLYNEIDQLGSVAEAQLETSHQLAMQRNAIQQEQAERAALGAARGARNRGDAALLERSAIGEAAFLGQEGARTQALQQTEYEGQLAQLRAQEENEKIRLKQSLIKDAIDAGMNQAALEVDIGKTDVASANNWINNEFEQLGINKQLDQRQTEALLSFAKDMATVQYQYDKMSSDEQLAFEQLLMDKYQIDETNKVALKRIKEENDYDWYSTLNAFVGGAAEGVGGGIGKVISSDIRVKENVEDADLEDLMENLRAINFNYKNPEKHGEGPQTGISAQDLQKSRLGSEMVSKSPERTLQVDGGKAGTVALAGLSMLFDKIKELEARLG